jgi:hypothetical protein
MSETETNIAVWQKEVPRQVVSQIESVATDTMRSASEMMTRTAEGQREAMDNAAEQFGEASRNFAHGNAEKMHTLLTFATTAHGGLHDLQECLTSLVEGVVRTNLRLAQEMFLVESPRAFAELQQRFLREYFDAFQQGAAALMRATAHSEETVTL